MSFTGWPDSGQRFQSSIPLTSTFSLPVSISEAGRLDGTGTLHINDRMLDQLFKLVHCLARSETQDSRSSLTHLIRRPLIPLSAGKWREGRTPISPLLVKTKADCRQTTEEGARKSFLPPTACLGQTCLPRSVDSPPNQSHRAPCVPPGGGGVEPASHQNSSSSAQVLAISICSSVSQTKTLCLAPSPLISLTTPPSSPSPRFLP